jgi:hypothetical protein
VESEHANYDRLTNAESGISRILCVWLRPRLGRLDGLVSTSQPIRSMILTDILSQKIHHLVEIVGRGSDLIPTRLVIQALRLHERVSDSSSFRQVILANNTYV